VKVQFSSFQLPWCGGTPDTSNIVTRSIVTEIRRYPAQFFKSVPPELCVALTATLPYVSGTYEVGKSESLCVGCGAIRQAVSANRYLLESQRICEAGSLRMMWTALVNNKITSNVCSFLETTTLGLFVRTSSNSRIILHMMLRVHASFYYSKGESGGLWAGKTGGGPWAFLPLLLAQREVVTNLKIHYHIYPQAPIVQTQLRVPVA
jgi:hypothetical protein